MDTLLLGILILLVVALLVVVIIMLSRKPQAATDLSTPLQTLTQAVQQGQTQTAVLAEKMARLEPVTQTTGSIQIELRGLSERVSQVEQNQSQANQGIATLERELAQTDTKTKSLLEAATHISSQLSSAKGDLTELQTYAKARQELEQRTADSIQRLEAIIAGTQSKGAAGENILEAVFAKLPPEWQARNFRVGNKTVEFGLRLPNNLVLPIDSKWAATNLLEQFVTCDDPNEKQKLKSQIEATVLNRAKEVKKYLDPSMTTDFGVVAVPDAMFDLCLGIQPEVFQLNMVLVSYSMFMPYLLLVFQTILKTSQNIDLEKLNTYLQSAQNSIKALQEELEGRFSRAITMLDNFRNEMRRELSKLSSGFASLQLSVSPSPSVTESSQPKSIDQG